MAPLTCPHCRAMIRSNKQALCLGCGWEVDQDQLVVMNPVNPSNDNPAVDSTPGGRTVTTLDDRRLACDHAGSTPGAALCTVCGEPTGTASRLEAHARGTVRFAVLELPWGQRVVHAGEVIDVGREVGPFEHELQAYGTVSRRHATIRMTESEKLLVRDHASTNGTFVNGVRCSSTGEVEVGDRSEIRFSHALRMIVRFEL